MSIRATVRMSGVAKNTIVELLAELGAVRCVEEQANAAHPIVTSYDV